MSASTAKVVLHSRSLRWSSPLLFNDPFDVPKEILFGITDQQIVDAYSRHIIKLLRQPPTDTSELSPKLKVIIDRVKLGIDPQLFAKIEATILEDATLATPNSGPMREFRAMWRSTVADMRILCLTESPSHIAMWYHYADKYAGIVLEFRCREQSDSPWFLARRVTYPEGKPAIYTAEGLAELLSLSVGVSVKRLLDVSAYSKSQDWSYENEWRILSFKRPTELGYYMDYPFSAEDLSTIYFGPLVQGETRAELLGLLKRFPNAKALSVSIGLSREFIFSETAG